MAKVAYILLCHTNPTAVIEQATQLTTAGDFVAIHYDARAPQAQFKELCDALGSNPNIAIVQKRIKCGWGEWSLVRATLATLTLAAGQFPKATHFYLLSGDCQAIKTGEYVHDFLDQHNADFIESVDFFKSNWIKTGLGHERVTYRHFVNERK